MTKAQKGSSQFSPPSHHYLERKEALEPKGVSHKFKLLHFSNQHAHGSTTLHLQRTPSLSKQTMGKKNLQKSSHQARLRDERLQRLQKTPFPQEIHHELIQANRRSHDRRHSRARGAKNLEREEGAALAKQQTTFPAANSLVV